MAKNPTSIGANCTPSVADATIQIVLAAIIIGLGVLRVFQEYKMKEYHRRIRNMG